MMNDEQLLRYSRQIMLDNFDLEGQQSLLDSKVLVVGLGGLGCPVSMYLAAAGVGELWLADHDVVDMSNLQRQIAHGTDDIGRPKAFSTAQTIKALNPDVNIHSISERLTGHFLEDAASRVDLVVDASDNFDTRFEVNRVCVAARKPLVSGAAIRAEGQVIVFDTRLDDQPCYRCLYSDSAGALDDSQLSCSESGVLSPLVGVIGSLQAMEALKCLTGYGDSLAGQLMIFDGKVMEWRKLKLSKDPQCPVCSAAAAVSVE